MALKDLMEMEDPETIGTPTRAAMWLAVPEEERPVMSAEEVEAVTPLPEARVATAAKPLGCWLMDFTV